MDLFIKLLHAIWSGKLSAGAMREGAHTVYPQSSTYEIYDSSMPGEYVCINYAFMLCIQHHIAHCHLDFLVY